jgi:hypothetical protein
MIKPEKRIFCRAIPSSALDTPPNQIIQEAQSEQPVALHRPSIRREYQPHKNTWSVKSRRCDLVEHHSCGKLIT